MQSSLNNTSLVLFFTKGMSLRAWDQLGMFDREVALYQRLRSYLGGVAFVTYGDVGDLAYARQLNGIDILCNAQNLAPEEYANAIPDLHGDYLKTVHVLKTNQILGAEVAVAAKRRYGCRLVTRCGFLWSEFAEREFGKDSLAAKAARQNEQAAFTQADHVVVTTSAACNCVNVGYQVAPEKISVIPNYVPTDRFKPLPHVSPVSGRICCVGRHDPQKNLPALFEAVAGLPVQLVFIGGAGMPGQLETKARELNLNVELKGNMPNAALPAELNRAELFVLPSLWEGHPKTILEAMACGRPVIGTDVPGIRELIVHGENGYLCQPDPASIRAAVETLLENKELQAHLGKKARTFVEEHFSLERILDMELAMLRRMTEMPLESGMFKRRFSKWFTGRNTISEPERGSSVTSTTETIPSTPADKAACLADEAITYAEGLDPAEALRFLFDLESRLYPIQGRMAVAYGGGLHTKHRHTNYHDFFVQRIKSGERVLDIGCGNGAMSYDMAKRGGAEVTGIDLGQENIAQAKERYAHQKIHYIAGDALTDLPSEQFDVIVMSNILEHLEKRPEFLRSVQARYHPKRWLIRVPLFERDWRVPLKRELGTEWRLDPTHCIEYTQETFSDEMRQAGLETVCQEVRWGEIWAELRGNKL